LVKPVPRTARVDRRRELARPLRDQSAAVHPRESGVHPRNVATGGQSWTLAFVGRLSNLSTKEHAMKMRSRPALLAAGLLAAAAGAAHADDPATYSIRETVTGTMIGESVITAHVPFEKTYAEMNPAQRAILAADYESMPPGDEPPYPALGLSHFTPDLVRYVEATHATGKLVAAVEVDPQGQARSVTVYKTPDAGMAQLVTALMVKESYKPARCGGSPCVMQYVLRLDFPERSAQHITPPMTGDSYHSMSKVP
jgi:hypothetical protein